MSPRRPGKPACLLRPIVAAVACCAPGVVLAQPDTTESYLLEHGLDTLAEVYLRERAADAVGDERVRLLKRLGAYYTQRLAEVTDAGERERLLNAATRVLESSDASEIMGLRLAVAIARYRPAEEIAERSRLMLATEDEIADAVEALRAGGAELAALAQQLERDVLYEERRQRAETARNPGSAVPELAEAIRNRSLANFYAGWAGVYEASLSESEAPARAALDHFAWVLDTPGETPSLERLPRSLLRYDHVARAAIGVGVAHSLLADHAGAFEWFDALEPEVSGEVRLQLDSRRLSALARAGRWEELRTLAHEPTPSVARARLLAVLALSARRDPDTSRLVLDDMAKAALASLIRLNELQHVLDLADRFGDLPLQGDGFAFDYVRGTELYAQAREAHRASGADPGAPAETAPVRAAYRSAAARLERAAASAQAAEFPRERARAAFEAGASLYYAGGLAEALEAFLRAEELAPDPEQRERALWMAFVSADALGDGVPPSAPSREAIARRYLSAHASAPRAAAMLLRTLGAELIPEDEGIDILRAVPAGDPVHALARRELARLLYRRVRRVEGLARAEAAAEFLALARDVMREDAARPPAEARAALSPVARQVLDVALLLDPPEVTLARETFDLLDDLGVTGRGSEHAEEFALRRVQLLLAEDRPAEARAAVAALPDSGSRYARAARTLLWAHALERWETDRGPAAARTLLAEAAWFLEQDPPDAAIAEAAARTAAWLWELHDDAGARELALAIDRRLIENEQFTESSLRRHARLTEEAERYGEAANAWTLLMAAHPPGSAPWHEARFESIRMLARSDPDRAREALEQFRALYPSFGPEPWPSRYTLLERTLPRRGETP